MPIDTTIMEPRPGSGDRSIPKSVSYEQIVQLAPFAGITARIFENARMFKPGMMVLRVYQRGETIIRQLDAGNSAFYILTEAEQERLGFAVEGAPRDPDCDLADVFVLDVEVRPVQRRPKFFGLLATIQQRPRRAPDRERAPQKRVATLQAGEIVGEMSCLRHTPRSATICATAPLVALEMLRNVFEKVNNNRKNDEFRQRLERVYAKRAIYSHLENSPMLQGVGAEMLRDLQNKVKLVVKKPGDIIIKVGEPITEELDSGEIASGAYLISLGQVRIIQERPGGEQIVGVAPEALLMPVRVQDLQRGLGSVSEVEALRYAADSGADVICCAWGPFGKPSERFPAAPITAAAIEWIVQHGRDGKGCVIVWAAGNDDADIALDGYTSNPNVIAVAACNDHGKRSSYSNWGDALWCVFPSNDRGDPHAAHREISTTTPTGSFRMGETFYTDSFGFTSAACAGVAGLCALILSANPELTWWQVKEVLRDSCVKIDAGSGTYDEHGHSPLYGYGRPDAGVAVELALARGRIPTGV